MFVAALGIELLGDPAWPTVPPEAPAGFNRQARRSLRSIRSALFLLSDSAGSFGGETYSHP